MSEEKKIKSKQTYTIETIHYEDGTALMKRVNDGYSVIEMIGLTTIIQNDLLDLYKKSFSKRLTKEVVRSSTNSPIIHKPETE
jgi:hypothetical protein